MAVNDSTPKNYDSLKSEEKPRFVPKQRTPYLLQEEVIKNKTEQSDTNLTQKEDNKQSNSNPEPLENLSETKSIQKDETLKQQAVNKRSQIVVNKESNSSQSALDINYYEEVGRLYGQQKKLAYYFLQCCKNRDQNQTGPVTSETLCSVVGTTHKTIKKIVQRMIEKKLITRINGKRGKGGFSSYELNSNFIFVLEGQAKLENNHLISNQINNVTHQKMANSLPVDWEKIDLSSLQEAFKLVKTKKQQDFGKTQLKAIYSNSKLSAADIQISITKFAYGLKNYFNQEPYSSMDNPAAILFDKLKNGDTWDEKRYLTTEENILFNIYKNILKQIEQNIHLYFEKWKEIDREKKFEYYGRQLSSTHFYNEKVFTEKAWEDYQKNIWPVEKKSLILQMVGISDSEIINKFEYILEF